MHGALALSLGRTAFSPPVVMPAGLGTDAGAGPRSASLPTAVGRVALVAERAVAVGVRARAAGLVETAHHTQAGPGVASDGCSRRSITGSAVSMVRIAVVPAAVGRVAHALAAVVHVRVVTLGEASRAAAGPPAARGKRE